MQSGCGESSEDISSDPTDLSGLDWTGLEEARKQVVFRSKDREKGQDQFCVWNQDTEDISMRHTSAPPFSETLLQLWTKEYVFSENAAEWKLKFTEAETEFWKLKRVPTV